MSTEPTPQTPVTAVVLAGGDASDPLARHAGVPAKAHVPVAGRPLADHVLTALAQARTVGHTVYVGEPPEGLHHPPDWQVGAGRRFSDSVALGLGAALAVSPGRRLLICTADLPWLSGSAVDRFIDAADAGLNYPVIPREVSERQFPDQRRTWVRLRQGQVTGGNVALIEPGLVPDLLLLADRFFAARKNPLALSSLLGFGTLVALLRGRADIPVLEAKMGELLGWSARAVFVDDAGLGADVDRPEQLPAG
ncbi:MAG TPA: NTP transferase domain-containing protein [Deinococcales bacterium]|nr:NTP transferase domain-containing protein [Deinococcales bacterium]